MNHWVATECTAINNLKISEKIANQANEKYLLLLKGLGLMLSFLIAGVGTFGIKHEAIVKWVLCGLVGGLPWCSSFFPAIEETVIENFANELNKRLDEIKLKPFQTTIVNNSAENIVKELSSEADVTLIVDASYQKIMKELDNQLKAWHEEAENHLQVISGSFLTRKSAGVFPANFSIIPSAYAQPPSRMLLVQNMPIQPTPVAAQITQAEVPKEKPAHREAPIPLDRDRQVELTIHPESGTLVVFGDTKSIDKSFYTNQEYNHLNAPGFGLAGDPESAYQVALRNGRIALEAYLKGEAADSPKGPSAGSFLRQPYYKRYYLKAGAFACVLFFKLTRDSLVSAYSADSIGHARVEARLRRSGAFTDTLMQDSAFLASGKVDTLAQISALSKQASAYYRVGLFSKTASAYSQSIRLDPLDAKPYGRRGNALLQMRKYDEAAQSLDQALVLNPKDTWDKYNLAKAQLYTGSQPNRDKAITNLQNLIRTDPSFKKTLSEDRQMARFQTIPAIRNLSESTEGVNE